MLVSIQQDKIDKFCIQLRRLENTYKNTVKFNHLNTTEKKILGNNSIFKNKYKNERCFIMGNGPSVNSIDFNKLGNELVITVNNMFFHKNFSDLKSDFHFLVDPLYYNLNRQRESDISYIEKIDDLLKKNVTLFMPRNALNGVKRNGWHKKDVHYLYNELYFYNGYIEKIDFAKYIPVFQGVILYCIAFAVYLGCKEIYLLGCDLTNIIPCFQAYINSQVEPLYAFEVPKKSKDLERRIGIGWGLEYMLYGNYKIVWGFSELYNYCKKNNIEMYNCSQESILESIPKCIFEDII